MSAEKKRAGRPSKAAVRADQILDAFTRCVARFGLEGATLQRVADEAGLARGHIRHYVGNRDELRDLFEQRIISRSIDRAAALASQSPAGRNAEALVHYFFGDELAPDDDNAAIDALLAAARFDADLRERIRAVYANLEKLLATALAEDHPGRSATVYENAAYQVLALAYGHWTFSELGFPPARTSPALDLALRVIKGVADTSSKAGH